jgi:hypothetical protein
VLPRTATLAPLRRATQRAAGHRDAATGNAGSAAPRFASPREGSKRTEASRTATLAGHGDERHGGEPQRVASPRADWQRWHRHASQRDAGGGIATLASQRPASLRASPHRNAGSATTRIARHGPERQRSAPTRNATLASHRFAAQRDAAHRIATPAWHGQHNQQEDNAKHRWPRSATRRFAPQRTAPHRNAGVAAISVPPSRPTPLRFATLAWQRSVSNRRAWTGAARQRIATRATTGGRDAGARPSPSPDDRLTTI